MGIRPRIILLAVTAMLLSAAMGGFTALAQPATTDTARLPAPVDMAVARPMPADPDRINAIGGARVSSTVPQGETAGLEPPLAGQAERGEATVPMWAKDGIFAPTAHPNHQIAIMLPDRLALGPAAWTGDGGAVYSRGSDVDDRVTRFPGGGVDVTVVRKSIFTSSTIGFGVKLPTGVHLRQGDNAVLVETDPVPGREAGVIGTFSIPAALDKNQAALAVTPRVGTGFPPGQSDLVIDLGPASIFAFPVTITLAYRASDVPTTGASGVNWQGLPAATPVSVTAAEPADYILDPEGLQRPDGLDPLIYAQRHSGHCQGGPDAYTSADGRTADFLSACKTQQLCLATTPTYTSVDSCDNRLLAHMSVRCTTVFGQTGPDYDACMRTASDQVAWTKANMPGGPE